MLIEGFPASMGTNCWVIADGVDPLCMIIDPGIDAADPLARLLDEHALRPVGVAITHGHPDHTWSVPTICERYEIPVYVNPADRAELMHLQPRLIGRTESSGAERTPIDPDGVRDLHDGDELEIGSIRLRVRHVPGHTPGSVLFEIESTEFTPGDVFTGDSLFAGSVGRTDLYGGSYEQLLQSMSRTVLTLDDSTRIHPGHGASSTVQHEREYNPYLQELQALHTGLPTPYPVTACRRERGHKSESCFPHAMSRSISAQSRLGANF